MHLYLHKMVQFGTKSIVFFRVQARTREMSASINVPAILHNT